MTDTLLSTSGGKLCDECSAPLGQDDDKRFKTCASCRKGSDVSASVGTPHPIAEGTALASAVVVTEAPEEMPGIKPIILDIERHRPEPPAERKHYWCGVTPDSPWSYITLGGQSFQKTIGEVVVDAQGGRSHFRDHVADGVILRLTKKDVDLVKQHAANKIVRNFREETIRSLDGEGQPVERKNFTGSIINLDHRNFRAQEDDRPIGEFVYMIEVRHKKDRPLDHPPTMVPRE